MVLRRRSVPPLTQSGNLHVVSEVLFKHTEGVQVAQGSEVVDVLGNSRPSRRCLESLQSPTRSTGGIPQKLEEPLFRVGDRFDLAKRRQLEDVLPIGIARCASNGTLRDEQPSFQHSHGNYANMGNARLRDLDSSLNFGDACFSWLVFRVAVDEQEFAWVESNGLYDPACQARHLRANSTGIRPLEVDVRDDSGLTDRPFDDRQQRAVRGSVR